MLVALWCGFDKSNFVYQAVIGIVLFAHNCSLQKYCGICKILCGKLGVFKVHGIVTMFNTFLLNKLVQLEQLKDKYLKTHNMILQPIGIIRSYKKVMKQGWSPISANIHLGI